MQRASMILPLLFVTAGCVVAKDTYLKKEAELAACVSAKAAGDQATEACRREGEARARELEARRMELEAAGQRQKDDYAELESCLAEKAALGQRVGAAEAASQQAQQETAAPKEANAKAAAELEKARQELASTRSEAESARRDAQAAKQEVESLKAREAELRAKLEKEIQDRTVEIEGLKARLSVRVVDRILFDSGRAEIKREGKAVLDKVAEVIGGTRERVRVEGHTDDQPVSKRLKGKFYSNWELSAARAANVVRYFQYGKGIDPGRMEAVGLGPYRPDAPNDSFEGRAQNRRVVIVLTAPAEAAAGQPPAPTAPKP